MRAMYISHNKINTFSDIMFMYVLNISTLLFLANKLLPSTFLSLFNIIAYPPPASICICTRLISISEKFILSLSLSRRRSCNSDAFLFLREFSRFSMPALTNIIIIAFVAPQNKYDTRSIHNGMGLDRFKVIFWYKTINSSSIYFILKWNGGGVVAGIRIWGNFVVILLIKYISPTGRRNKWQ